MKSGTLTKKQCTTMLDDVSADLEVYDLLEWQKACRGFGPIHLDKQTRKEWFKDNKPRLPAAREIVGFIESWKTNYQNDEKFSDVRVTVIIKALNDVVRKSQNCLISCIHVSYRMEKFRKSCTPFL